jgi:hypothetical protein
MVRGYWGDIIDSPYIAYGLEVLDEEHRDRFYRELNM